MGKKGFGKMLKNGMENGMAKGITKAQRIGEGVKSRAGPVLTGLGMLETMEQYSNIELSVEILAKMEARMLDRLTIAEKTLENAKRSPYLKNSESVPQLETVIETCRKFVTHLGSCGPLLRGASLHEYNPVMARHGTWLTDALIAVQLDIIIAISNGEGVGRMPQVASQGYNPDGGGAPGQMQGPGDPGGNAMMGPYPQQFLVPTPTIPGQPHPQQQQVPMGEMHGMPQMRTAPVSQIAMPTRSAGWPKNSKVVRPMMHDTTAAVGGSGGPGEDGLPKNLNETPPMLMHQTSPATVGVAADHDGVEGPNNSGAVPSMMNGKPAVEGAPISSDKDSVSRVAPQPTAEGAGRGYEHIAWDNLGDPSSHRSLAETAAFGSDGTISPVPSDAATQTAQMAPGIVVDGTEHMRRSYPISPATRKLREALGIDRIKWHGHSPPFFLAKKKFRGVQGDGRTGWSSLSTTSPQVHNKMPGATFGGHIVYDNLGYPYYFDANTGHCYPTG